MVEYKLIKSDTCCDYCDYHSTYGISVYDNNKLIKSVHDISVDKIAVEKLIEKLNKHGLSLCHLSEIIEDYLYDLSID